MKKLFKKGIKEQASCLLFVGIVILVLAGCSVYMRIKPDQIYSSAERRMLAERPKLTKNRVLKGKFQEEYERYLSEQFPGREQFVTLQTKLSRALGKKDAEGVYFGRDDYLLEQYQEQDFDWSRIEKNVKRTARFLKKYPKARVMFVPSKSMVLAEKLPLFAQNSGEERFFALTRQQIPKDQQIFVSDVLNARDAEYIYYRTDHHWTALGAYYAYEAWADAMGILPSGLEDFTVTDICSTFLGTTYAKVRTGGRADTISLYERIDGPAFALDHNMGEFQSDSFFQREKAQGDDPYSVFLGGNQAVSDIRRVLESEEESGQAEENGPDETGEGRTLLVVKDSFGNCFVPFAAGHYARTIVIDLRYVNIPVGRLLKMYPADDILILYNSIQFMEDQDIRKLK